ncbi:MAG: DUF4173 domain-containing protein [Clostridiales bacterium]|nr:DUF4173 domain-containing protein [Clostridiales bacterium]
MNTNTKRAELLKKLCLGLSYAFSYAYICFFTIYTDSHLAIMVFLTLLSCGAILWLELTMRQQQDLGKFTPSKLQLGETRFWEVILLLLSISTLSGQMQELSLLFIHMVVIYMVLTGTGHLLSDRSSCLIPADLFNGCVRLPFMNFFSRIPTIGECIHPSGETVEVILPDGSTVAGTKAKKKPGYSAAILLVLVVIAGFFFAAVGNLASVDSHFSDAILSLEHTFDNISISDSLGRFIMSLPVGAFLFGLFQGSVRKDISKEKHFCEKLVSFSTRLRFMPDAVLTAVLFLFGVLYVAFFISQASYMFSAFAGVLPEAFTASEYAVSGFYELINVVLINFALLATVRIFGSHENRILRIFSTVLMVESMIFATISASKIILYMSRFGYTYSRTLGLWGTSVVFAGAILAVIYLTKKKQTFAPWMWYSAGSYVVMAFITWCFV